jgi:predicted acetyltransferase
MAGLVNGLGHGLTLELPIGQTSPMTQRPHVTVVEASEGQRELLVRLMQLYLHDLSAVESWDVDSTGSFGDDDLDGCWTDARRHPFVILADGKIAGFAIVDEGSDVTGDPEVFDMAEFFVVRRWRRHRVGHRAVQQLTARFPGRWEVRPFPGYPPGEQFWHRVCSDVSVVVPVVGTFERGGKSFPMYSLVVE